MWQQTFTQQKTIYLEWFNFLAEGHKLKEAFKSAISAGLKNADGTFVKMPKDLDLMKEAAKIVRETVPNYAYVSDFVKRN